MSYVYHWPPNPKWKSNFREPNLQNKGTIITPSSTCSSNYTPTTTNMGSKKKGRCFRPFFVHLTKRQKLVSPHFFRMCSGEGPTPPASTGPSNWCLFFLWRVLHFNLKIEMMSFAFWFKCLRLHLPGSQPPILKKWWVLVDDKPLGFGRAT